MGILLIIGIILLVLWLLGIFVWSLSGLIYIALVVGVILMKRQELPAVSAAGMNCPKRCI